MFRPTDTPFGLTPPRPADPDARHVGTLVHEPTPDRRARPLRPLPSRVTADALTRRAPPPREVDPEGDTEDTADGE